MNKEDIQGLGKIAFLVGLLAAVFSGFIPRDFELADEIQVGLALMLALLGVLMGTYTIKQEQRVNFLIAIMTLLLSVTAAMTAFPKGIDVIPVLAIRAILTNVGALLGPAAITVSLKLVFDIITRD